MSKSKKLFLVLEKDLSLGETEFMDIFIADSLEKVDEILGTYYEDVIKLSKEDLKEDTGLRYVETLLIDRNYIVEIAVREYKLNRI